MLQDIDLEGFEEFLSLYVENDLPRDMVRRLFLSFVKRAKTAPIGFSVTTVGPTVGGGGGGGGGGLFSQSSSTITGAIHSLGSRFNFSSLTGTGSNSYSKQPAPSQSVPEGTKLLCTVSDGVCSC